MVAHYTLTAPYEPAGDQPQAIRSLVEGVKKGLTDQTLVGVTGSGKTFTIANVVAQTGRPVLIISHNKTLAAQLFEEMKEFLGSASPVGFFISYFDYYQPEAYVPSKDLYIAKESDRNEEIEKHRHAATQALTTRDDIVVVASVSCIYGLGDPNEYRSQRLALSVGDKLPREDLLRKLVEIYYTRNDTAPE